MNLYYYRKGFLNKCPFTFPKITLAHVYYNYNKVLCYVYHNDSTVTHIYSLNGRITLDLQKVIGRIIEKLLHLNFSRKIKIVLSKSQTD